MNGRGIKLEVLWHNLRFAFRVLRKYPAFTLIATLTIALGIGANTAMFSVANAVLLRPLPYPHPKQLVRIGPPEAQSAVSVFEYQYWKENNNVFASIAAYRDIGDRYLSSNGTQNWIKAIAVSPEFLRVLGVTPAFGREFNSEETQTTGVSPVLLSDRLWRESFKADDQILGRQINIDSQTYAVVGILPRTFWFAVPMDVLVPLRVTGGIDDQGANTSVIARLKDKQGIKLAQAEVARLDDNFQRQAATHNRQQNSRMVLTDYQDWLVGAVRTNLLLLLGTTAVLFFIANSNLVSLLIARMIGRQSEIALRLALGSSRARLHFQFLVENLVLCAMGTAAGLLIAYYVLNTLVAFFPFQLPGFASVKLDRFVIIVALSGFLGIVLLFTLIPTLAVAGRNVHESLKSGGRTSGTTAARRRIGNALAVGQIALSAMLVIIAALMIQSLYRLHHEQLGFLPQGLTTFETPLAHERYPDAPSIVRFTDLLRQRLATIPGVQNVAAVNQLPLKGGINLPAQRDGYPEQSIGGMEVRLVTASYFETMGIAVKRGRAIGLDDTSTSTPVALVNETLARLWWSHGDPLNDRVIIGRYKGKEFAEIKDKVREIVGVVADTKTSLTATPGPTLYIPIQQSKAGFLSMTGKLAWVVRTATSASIQRQLRTTIAEIDTEQRVQELRTMNDIVAASASNSQFDAYLFGAFAAIALMLATVGIYGLLSSVVAQRRQEIGTRMALGASQSSILNLILKQGFLLAATGLGLGVLGALLLGRVLSSLLYNIKFSDPLTLIASVAIMLMVALLASYIPSRRAAKIDPIVALRYE